MVHGIDCDAFLKQVNYFIEVTEERAAQEQEQK
jgi:hypothetical protein